MIDREGIAAALARFVPADPGYAPFGWGALRGLNALPIALAALVGLLWGLDALARNWVADVLTFQQGLLGIPPRVLCAEIDLMPLIVLAMLALNHTAGRGGAARATGLALAWLLGSLLGALVWSPASCVIAGTREWSDPDCQALAFGRHHLGGISRIGAAGAVLMALLYLHRHELEVAAELHRAQLQRLDAQRQESAVRLQSLQAQMEPHFLFNTLAHIQRLHQVNARQGASMLANLVDYMRSSQGQMRESASTLGRELALVRSYAGVQQIRMGERLRVEIDAPPELLDARLPPMMVLTLAENAVKHGLSPKRAGGTLRIEARRQGGQLHVAVRDDGVGLRPGSGPGIGLANTRARLATLYGREGRLDLGNNEAGGVSALLVMPLAHLSRS